MKPCQICAGNRFRKFAREAGWTYILCRDCGLVRIDPFPDRVFLQEHYRDYLPSAPEEVEQWRRMSRVVVRKSAGLLTEELPRPGRILDVGCAYGFFLEEMRNRGWAVEGIEISPTGRRYASEVLGLEVSVRGLPDPGREPASFDAVTLFYVIEHLPDPREVLAEVRRLLRPGGALLLRWPHTTPIVKVLRPWAERLELYHSPSHLFDFSPSTLGCLLEQTGFTAIRHGILGWTRPAGRGPRLVSFMCGAAGEYLWRMSGGRMLLPGVSKITLARRP
jgi:SAM-dependent methyltransferase